MKLTKGRIQKLILSQTQTRKLNNNKRIIHNNKNRYIVTLKNNNKNINLRSRTLKYLQTSK